MMMLILQLESEVEDEQGCPTKHIISHIGDGFLQVDWPNQQYQSTEGRELQSDAYHKQLRREIYKRTEQSKPNTNSYLIKENTQQWQLRSTNENSITPHMVHVKTKKMYKFEQHTNMTTSRSKRVVFRNSVIGVSTGFHLAKWHRHSIMRYLNNSLNHNKLL